MRAVFSLLQTQALKTSFLTESMAASVREDVRTNWLKERASHLGSEIKTHQDLAGKNLKLASVGLVSATGVLLAGGPHELGIAAFLAGSASSGAAIFHLATAKFAEIRQSLGNGMSHGRPLTQEERIVLTEDARKLTMGVWDDSMKELRAQMFAAHATPKSAKSKP
ncbi:hypothetical protein [Hydrogenophaga sp. 2FB]|uniref:hypothetical protein n=1 Tax=Hydrogenophaga sp. 2FB TaxID=2502187 RepID=UPI0010F6A6ED|nr:hypothetical protein [Hydrogenophaga sp. 2FB]